VSSKESWPSVARALVREAFRIFSERGARLMSGSIAFYALLSVVPILVVVLRVAGPIVTPERIDSTVSAELAGWVGPSGARTILELAGNIGQSRASTFTNLLGALTLVYASTRLFSQLTTALDLLWGTPPPARAKHFAERVRRQIERRGVAFVMVLVVGLLLLGLTLVHAALATAREAVGLAALPTSRLLEAPGSFVVAALLFAAMFRLLPRAQVALRDALVGGAVTALLFTLGSLVVSAYVAHRDISVYGAASRIVMLMLWAHYSAHIFFLGAAFTAACSRRRERGTGAASASPAA
jgi:membrane protein